MSRNVSLENFECGSWASAAMSHEIDGDSNNSYFDLPLELMKYGAATDSNSPIDCSAASFCYEKEIKGVLKIVQLEGVLENWTRHRDTFGFLYHLLLHHTLHLQHFVLVLV
ncbi:root hair specific protein [Trifolium repens]|nr:root hair specific protein [Trifolium repens]